MITQEYLKSQLCYDNETGIFTNLIQRNPRAPKDKVAGTLNTIGYVVIQLVGKKIHAHRLAWLYVYGELPKGQIDHINGIRSDNRIGNLRDVSTSENLHNTGKQKRNTTGIKGVTWHKRNKRWQAQIMANNKYYYLGMYQDINEAHLAYLKAEKELHPTKPNGPDPRI